MGYAPRVCPEGYKLANDIISSVPYPVDSPTALFRRNP